MNHKEEERHVEYQTTRVILKAYDAIADAAASVQPCRTVLTPPPADPTVARWQTRVAPKEASV